MRLKSKLPALMEQKGVDQKTVAAATGLSPTTVGKLYRNHFDRIDNHTVTSLCKYFGLKKLDELIEIIWEPDDEAEAGFFSPQMNEVKHSDNEVAKRSRRKIAPDSKVVQFPIWRIS